MSKFRPNNFTVSEDKAKAPEVRVFKGEQKVEPVVQQFDFGKLKRQGEGSYAAVKGKFGALAATDGDPGRLRCLRGPARLEQVWAEGALCAC